MQGGGALVDEPWLMVELEPWLMVELEPWLMVDLES